MTARKKEPTGKERAVVRILARTAEKRKAKAQLLGAKIRTLREAKGWPGQKLADVFGISRGSVSDWENGRYRPESDKLVRLAEALGTTVEYLLEDSDHNVPVIGELKNVSAPKVTSQRPASTDQPTGKLPVISWSEAGNWDETMKTLNLRDDIQYIECPFAGDFVLRVVGDSMFNPGSKPSLEDGEYVYIDTKGELAHRKVVVVLRKGDKVPSLKQLLMETDGTAMLHVLNPAWPNRYVPLDADSTIVGVVTGRVSAM